MTAWPNKEGGGRVSKCSCLEGGGRMSVPNKEGGGRIYAWPNKEGGGKVEGRVCGRVWKEVG